MTDNGYETSKAANKRLIKNHTDKRVSEDSVEELQDYIENQVVPELVRGAVAASDHAGRETLMKEDLSESTRVFEK